MDKRSSFTRTIRDALQERAAELSRTVASELEELANGSEEHHLADVEDLGGDATDNEVTFSLMELESDTLEQINWALARIDEGTYGTCEECGADIPQERLVALPLATRCIECQRVAEREQESGEGGAL